MKRTIIFTLILLTCLTPLYPQNSALVHTGKIYNDIFFFDNNDSRAEGSNNEKQVITYIKTRLDEIQAEYIDYDFTEAERYYSYSKNIEVNFMGNSGSEHNIVLVFPLNRETNSSFSSSFNLALGLYLSDYFSENPPSVNLKILFLGAENRNTGIKQAGTELFLNRYSREEDTVVFYMNLTSSTSSFSIIPGGSGLLCPEWMVHASMESFDKNNIPFFMDSTLLQIIRLNQFSFPSLTTPYLEKDIPALLLESSEGNPENQETAASNFVSFLTTFMENYTEGFPQTKDTHYLYAGNSTYYFILGEPPYILFITIFLIVLIFLIYIFPKKFKIRFRYLLKKLWSLPLIFLFTVFFLIISSIISQGMSQLSQNSKLMSTNPFIFFSLKITLTAFFYYSMFHILRRGPFTESSHFYSYSAFLCTFITFLFLIGLNLAFSIYALGAVIATLFFTVSRKKYQKWFFFLLTISPYSIIAFDIFTKPYSSVVSLLMQTNILSNIILGLLIFPYFLMVSCIHYMPHRYPHRHNHIWTIINNTISGLLALTLSIIILMSPKDETITYQLEEEILNDIGIQYLKIDPEPKIDINISSNLNSYHFFPELKRSLSYNNRVDIFQIETEIERFMGRKLVSLGFDFTYPPGELKLNFSSEEPIIIFDSNYPIEVSPDGMKVTFFTGINPPNPLQLDFVLLRDTILNANLELIYPESPFNYQSNDLITFNPGSLKVKDSFIIN